MRPETLTIDLLAAFAPMQSILPGYILASLLTAETVVMVGDSLAIVIDTAIDNVAVRMVMVVMTDNHEEGVPDTHPFHVIMGDCLHQFRVSLQLRLVLRREVERDVDTVDFDTRVHLRLCVKFKTHQIRFI